MASTAPLLHPFGKHPLLLILLLAGSQPALSARPGGVFQSGEFSPRLVSDYFTGLESNPGKGMPTDLAAKKLGCDRNKEKPEKTYKFVAGDLNGDGKPDLISLGKDGEKVWIYLNGGTIGSPRFDATLPHQDMNNGMSWVYKPYAFQLPNFDTNTPGYQNNDPGSDPNGFENTGKDIIVGDLNGDGRNDILISGRWTFWYYENTGNVIKDIGGTPRLEPQFTKKPISSALKFNFAFCSLTGCSGASCRVVDSDDEACLNEGGTDMAAQCDFPKCNHADGMVYPRPRIVDFNGDGVNDLVFSGVASHGHHQYEGRAVVLWFKNGGTKTNPDFSAGHLSSVNSPRVFKWSTAAVPTFGDDGEVGCAADDGSTAGGYCHTKWGKHLSLDFADLSSDGLPDMIVSADFGIDAIVLLQADGTLDTSGPKGPPAQLFFLLNVGTSDSWKFELVGSSRTSDEMPNGNPLRSIKPDSHLQLTLHDMNGDGIPEVVVSENPKLYKP